MCGFNIGDSHFNIGDSHFPLLHFFFIRCVVVTADESSQTYIIGIFDKYVRAVLLDWPTIIRIQGVQYRFIIAIAVSI